VDVYRIIGILPPATSDEAMAALVTAIEGTDEGGEDHAEK
jgi:hypothetical protein